MIPSPLNVERQGSGAPLLLDAPTAYDNFQKKADGTVEVVFKP